MKKSIKIISLFLTVITLAFSVSPSISTVYAAEKAQQTYQHTQQDIESLTALSGILLTLTGISDIKDYCFG